MKTLFLYIMCAMMLVGTTSCHNDSEDYLTTGHIVLSLPFEGEIESLQYSIKMMDLNSRNTITQAGDADGTIAVENIFRGAYSINVEGVLRYADSDAIVHTSQFRAQSDYVSMVGLDDNVISLEMILMD